MLLAYLFPCCLVYLLSVVLFPRFASGRNNLFLKLGHNNHGLHIYCIYHGPPTGRRNNGPSKGRSINGPSTGRMIDRPNMG